MLAFHGKQVQAAQQQLLHLSPIQQLKSALKKSEMMWIAHVLQLNGMGERENGNSDAIPCH